MGKLSLTSMCCKIHINHSLLLLLFYFLYRTICRAFPPSLSLLNTNASKIFWVWLMRGRAASEDAQWCLTPGSALHPSLNWLFNLKQRNTVVTNTFFVLNPFTSKRFCSKWPDFAQASEDSRGDWVHFCWQCPGYTQQDRQHLEAGAAPRWHLYVGHAAGPPTPAGMAQASPALPGAPPAPSRPTQTPSGCSPAPHPYLCPLIFHAFIKQELFSLRLHCAEGNCSCHCSPKGCAFLRQLDLYQALRCRDKDCWVSVGWHGLT